MSAKVKALVTLAIGEDYLRMWEAYYKPSLEKYAEKHGYDLFVIDDYLDATPRGPERTPHWQKLLILEHPEFRQYEHVVWIDADININFHHAPCIVDHAGDTDALGLVSHNQAYVNDELWTNRWHRAHQLGGGIFERPHGPSPVERYREAGLPDDVDDMVNTGVMVLQPAKHAEFLRWIYDTCDENPYSANEQMSLSYHIFRQGLFQPLDPRFNRTWSEEMVQNYPFLMNNLTREIQPVMALCVTAAWLNTWFLHFLADGLSRGDVQFILSQFDDPTKINLQELMGPVES